MRAFLAFAAVVALGLFVKWVFYHWIDFVGDLETAAMIWMPTILLIAFIVDWRERRRSD